MTSDPRVKAAISHWGAALRRQWRHAHRLRGGDRARLQAMTTGAAPGRRAPPCTSRWAARRSPRGTSSPPAKPCSAPASIIISPRSCSCTISAQMKAAHKKQIECRQLALPHLAAAGRARRNSLSGQDASPASCASRQGVERPPVVVMAVGLDSTKEETEAYEAPFLARGIATLVFEGPGQGEAQYDFAIRGDYEVPVAGGARFRRDAPRSRHRAHRPCGA